MFPITRDRRGIPSYDYRTTKRKADFTPGWGLTFTFGTVGLHIYSKEGESFEIIRSVGEVIDGGLQISPHGCTRKWCNFLSKWQRTELLLWFLKKKKGLKWGSFRNGRNLFFILPGLRTVPEDCRDFSPLWLLPQEKLMLSQNGIQRHHSLAAFLQQDWGNNSNKLQDVLQLSGRAVAQNISFLWGLINVTVQFECFVQLQKNSLILQGRNSYIYPPSSIFLHCFPVIWNWGMLIKQIYIVL